MTTLNLAGWRRRALRAEEELSRLRAIRKSDSAMERRLIVENADLANCVREIREALENLKLEAWT